MHPPEATVHGYNSNMPSTKPGENLPATHPLKPGLHLQICIVAFTLLTLAACAPLPRAGTSLPAVANTRPPATTIPLPTNTLLPPATIPTSLPPTQPALAGLPACIHGLAESGAVVKVVDGDTIRVDINGQEFPVRYIGVDTPESTRQHEAFGEEAAAQNKALVAGARVRLYSDTSNTDAFGRLLRYVFVEDVFINLALVNLGFAEALEYPPDTACASLLEEAETNARALGLGMWAANLLPTPTGINQPVRIIEVNKQAEYVIIRNDSNAPIDLKGWKMVSEKGSQVCDLGGSLPPGTTLQIWSQVGPGFSCYFPGPIWSNSAVDPAVLYNPQGQEIDRR